MLKILHSHTFTSTPALRAFAEQSIETQFSRFSSRVVSVNIYLSDVNGLRGGVDKRCGVEVGLTRRRRLFVEETRQDVYISIGHAIERAASAVEKTLERSKNRRTSEMFRRVA